MKDPARILIVRLSHLGDVVCSLPVFHALRDAHPKAEVGWLVQSAFAGLLEGMEGLQRVFRFEREGGIRAWLRVRRALRAWSPDLVVDAQGNLKSASFVWASGAPRRAGAHRDDWRERRGAWVLNEAAPPLPGSDRHALLRAIRLARAVAPAGVATPPRCDPALSEIERAAGERALDAHLPGASPGDRILHPSPPGDVRAWPLERYVELARLEAAEGRRVLVVTGPAEPRAGHDLRTRLGGVEGVHHWTAQADLRALAGLFAAAARRGLSLVGADSGPMHLASAVGLPAVVVEGPQDGGRTGPWSADVGPRLEHVVRAAEAPACAPCLARRCSHPEGPVCMERVGAEEVARVRPLPGSIPR